MKTHKLSNAIGSENPNEKQQKYSADIGRKALDIPKRAMANGHSNLNGGGRKRSVEPRPHPAKLLNKRYWDDVRAGRVCPPRALKEEEDPITTKHTTLGKAQYYTKSAAKSGEKRRKASMPSEMETQNAKSNANFQNSVPTAVQHGPTAGSFSPQNQSQFQPQGLGIAQLGNSFAAQSQRLLRFAPFLPPPLHPQDILRPPAPLFAPPADHFLPSQFAPPFEASATALPTSVMSMHMAIPPLLMLQQQRQQQLFGNSAEATTWTFLEMLAKGTTPNGQKPRSETEHQQTHGTNNGQQNGTAETAKNRGPLIVSFPPYSEVGCSSNLSSNSESDAQIDQLMDRIARKSEHNTQIISDRHAPYSQLRSGECRLCFVPIPMPVPVPVPVSSDFVLKHFGTKNQ